MDLAELLARSVSQTPDKVALEMGADSLTYRQLWDQSSVLAELLSKSGVRHDDRVLLYADNHLATYVIYLATARVGAVFAPVHSSFQTKELAYVLGNSSPAVIFTQQALLGSLVDNSELLPFMPQHVLCVDEIFADENVAEDPVPQPPHATNADSAPALICYTSGGASATPTPVTRSHAAEVWNAQTYARVWDIRADDRVLVALPLSWVYGLSTLGLSALSAGATLVLQSAVEPEPLLQAIERDDITVFAGTMSMFSRLVGELQKLSHDHSSLRHLYIGGEPVLMPVVKLVEHYTGIRPLQAYATTEVAPVLAIDPVADPDSPDGTVGRLVEGSEIRLVNAHGDDVRQGEIGEALLRSRGAMTGYWNEPAMTSSRMTEDGWYRSGDFMWSDPQGYYFMVGRGGDIIIRGGAKVALIEVESAIAELAGIDDAVVVAVPDEEFGEALIAFVVATRQAIVSVDTIYDALGSRIARFKLPREIYILKEFPLGFTGKRDRHHLRQLAEGQLSPDGVVTMVDWLTRRSRRLDSG